MNFSVLLSVYHKEKAGNLKQSLNSIIYQSLMPAEIILVKDGPLNKELDATITEFTANYPELIKVIKLEKNVGLGEALRIGVEHCSHELIARMDTDDVARPNRFEKQVRFFEDHPYIDILGSNIEEFNMVPGDLRQFKINPETHQSLVSGIKLRSPFNHPSIMMKKASLLKAGNYNGDILLFEDYSLFLRMWLEGLQFYNIQEILLDFRIGSGIETIKRRSGMHYVTKELRFLKYAKSIGAFSSLDIFRYVVIKLPLRLLPSKMVLLIYNNILRHK